MVDNYKKSLSGESTLDLHSKDGKFSADRKNKVHKKNI